MNVLIINKSDVTGGAAVVSYRLLQSLVSAGIDARMLVVEKGTDDCRVEKAYSDMRMKMPFLWERLKIFLANGLNRTTLFKIDTASNGLPLHKHPWVKEADLICLGWINQGMLSLKGIRKIADMHKPIVWIMHDMWNLTAICHHAGKCHHWKHQCGNCHLLGENSSSHDLSFRTMQRKHTFYQYVKHISATGKGIHFIAVSNWVASLARQSSLMHDAALSVIPNPIYINEKTKKSINKKYGVMFGAARLDDPVKGLPILNKCMEILASEYPEIAGLIELRTFGAVKDESQLHFAGIQHHHLGLLSAADVEKELNAGSLVLSTSLYETLPTTLIEGQVYGCIPVSLNRGGQSDIIEHKKTGYLAQWPENDDPEETARRVAQGIVWAVKQLQTDPEGIRSAMYESAKQRFGAESVAARYISLFKSLTGGSDN